MAKVIEANTQITNLQSDVFKFQASISGTVFLDRNSNGQRDRNEPGVPFIMVHLLDSNGNIVATTRTDLSGHYTFNQLSGLAANIEEGSGISATGDYSVVIVLPRFAHQTTTDPAPVDVTRGDINVSGQDFGIVFSFGGWNDALPGNHQHDGYSAWLDGDCAN